MHVNPFPINYCALVHACNYFSLSYRKYKEMMGLLNSYEDEVFQLWNLSISKKMTNSLGKSLILREGESDNAVLRVNFGKDLISVLREVRSKTFELNIRVIQPI